MAFLMKYFEKLANDFVAYTNLYYDCKLGDNLLNLRPGDTFDCPYELNYSWIVINILRLSLDENLLIYLSTTENSNFFYMNRFLKLNFFSLTLNRKWW